MTYNLTPRGPFETPEQVFDAAAPLREAVHSIDPGDTLIADLRARWIDIRAHYVISTLTGCGVELGAQDERTARWIAATLDQPETAVILDWILRAHQGAAPAEDETTVISWVLYRPQPGSEILEPAGVDGDVSPVPDPAELAVEKLIEYATGAWDHMVKVYGTRGQLAAWAQWEDGEAVAYRNGGAR